MIRKASEEKFSYLIIQKRPKPAKAAVPAKKQQPPAKAAEKKVAKGGKSEVAELVVPAKRDPISLGSWTSTAALSEADRQRMGESDSLGNAPHPTPLNVLKRFVDVGPDEAQEVVDALLTEVDWDEYAPPLRREEYGRILRAPQKHRGHISMDLCGPSGRIHRSTLSRSNLLGMPSLYSALRKTSWGGLVPVLDGEGEDAQQSPLTIKSKGHRGQQEARQTKTAEKKEKRVREPLHIVVDRVKGSKPGAMYEDEDNEDNENPFEQEMQALTRKAKKSGRAAQQEEIDPEERQLREMLRKQNHFTGRPLNAKTFYPKVEPKYPLYKSAPPSPPKPEVEEEPKAGRRRESSSLLGRMAEARRKRAAKSSGDE